MMFRTQTYGKWILCGEQAVLRGHPALVFPLANVQLNLSYQPHPHAVEIITNHPQLQTAILKVWQMAWGQDQGGRLEIKSNIPCGQGMGASAALCLAIARCVAHFKPQNNSLWDFGKNLENLFHGQSSGIDILGVGSSGPLWFQNGKWENIKLKWQPQWVLTPSLELGQTAQAIQTVKQLWQADPRLAAAIDAKMETASKMARQALETQDQSGLAESMRLAETCFATWGLISPKMQAIIDDLYHQGALAVKPTGSGGGGYLLSLWEQAPKNLGQDSFQIILPSDNKPHRV